MIACTHVWANSDRRPLLGAYLDGLEGALLACATCGELWPGEPIPKPDPSTARLGHEAVTR